MLHSTAVAAAATRLCVVGIRAIASASAVGKEISTGESEKRELSSKVTPVGGLVVFRILTRLIGSSFAQPIDPVAGLIVDIIDLLGIPPH